MRLNIFVLDSIVPLFTYHRLLKFNRTVCFLWARRCCRYVFPSYYELEASGDNFINFQKPSLVTSVLLCAENALHHVVGLLFKVLEGG